MENEERIERLEHTVLDLSGRLTATEFAVRVLIANHPDPARIYERWHATIPELVDILMSNPMYAERPQQRDGLHDQLGTYSREVQKLKRTDIP